MISKGSRISQLTHGLIVKFPETQESELGRKGRETAVVSRGARSGLVPRVGKGANITYFKKTKIILMNDFTPRTKQNCNSISINIFKTSVFITVR